MTVKQFRSFEHGIMAGVGQNDGVEVGMDKEKNSNNSYP